MKIQVIARCVFTVGLLLLVWMGVKWALYLCITLQAISFEFVGYKRRG